MWQSNAHAKANVNLKKKKTFVLPPSLPNRNNGTRTKNTNGPISLPCGPHQIFFRILRPKLPPTFLNLHGTETMECSLRLLFRTENKIAEKKNNETRMCCPSITKIFACPSRIYLQIEKRSVNGANCCFVV